MLFPIILSTTGTGVISSTSLSIKAFVPYPLILGKRTGYTTFATKTEEPTWNWWDWVKKSRHKKGDGWPGGETRIWTKQMLALKSDRGHTSLWPIPPTKSPWRLSCGLYLDVTGKVAYRREGWHRATDICPAGAGRIMAWRYAQGSMGIPEHGLWWNWRCIQDKGLGMIPLPHNSSLEGQAGLVGCTGS